MSEDTSVSLSGRQREAPTPKGFWASRTPKQKFFIIACSGVIFVVALVIAFFSGWILRGDSSNDIQQSSLTSKENEEICTTSACVDSANYIIKNMNQSEDPCNKFYEFACGGFMENTHLSDAFPEINILQPILNQIIVKIRLALEKKSKSKSKSVKRAQTAYQICLNKLREQQNETKQLSNIVKDLGALPVLQKNKIITHDIDLTGLLVKSFQLDSNFAALFRFSVIPNPRKTSKNMIKIYPYPINENHANLGKDKNWKLNLKRKMVDIMKLLGTHDNIMSQGSISDKDVDEMISFEEELSKADSSHPLSSDHISLEELSNIVPSIQFDRLFHELAPENVKHLINKHTVVAAHDYHLLTHLNNVINRRGLKTTVKYVFWKLMTTYSSNPDDRSYFMNQKSHEKSYLEPRESWEICAEFVNKHMPITVGALYVEHFFPKEDKIRVQKMVADVKETYLAMLKDNDWMDEETKKNAITKAQRIVAIVGYREELKNDTYLDSLNETAEISSTDTVLTLKSKGSRTSLTKTFDKLLKRGDGYEDDDLENIEPTVMNGFYEKHDNLIILTASFSQAPRYSADYSMFMNYGNIGSLIAHEITHAFDRSGSRYDADGELTNWWTNRSAEEFKNRADCMVNQYKNISLPGFPDLHIRERTLDENIADNGAVKAAYLAYKKYVQKNGPEKRLPGLQKFTSEQLYFVTVAQGQCHKFSYEAMKFFIWRNSHPPGYGRVLGSLSNLKSFAETFDCPLGSKYNPPNKCLVW